VDWGECPLQTFGVEIKTVATGCQILGLNFTKFDLGCGSAGETYRPSPRPKLDLRGQTFNDREGREKRRKGTEGRGCQSGLDPVPVVLILGLGVGLGYLALA